MIVIAVVLAYLIGSAPVGVLICRPLGKDPRLVGSGRTGGTNVYRAAGLAPAIATAIGDVAKGWLSVWLAVRLVPGGGQVLAVALAALAAIIGHNHSLFLGFKGGAGATPDLGAALAIDLPVALVALLAGAVGLFGVRIAAVATLSAATVIMLGLTWRVITAVGPYAQPALLVYAVGQLLIIVWSLRPNLARLRAGTERRIALRRPTAPVDPGPPPGGPDSGSPGIESEADAHNDQAVGS